MKLTFFGLWLLFLKRPVFRIYHGRYARSGGCEGNCSDQLSQVARIAQISQQTSAMGAKTAATLGHGSDWVTG